MARKRRTTEARIRQEAERYGWTIERKQPDDCNVWLTLTRKGRERVAVSIFVSDIHPQATGRVMQVRDEHGHLAGVKALLFRLRLDRCPWCQPT